MTNYLKELASMRHYNMMDEGYLMNECKETVCFVSRDFRGDLERTWKGNNRQSTRTRNPQNVSTDDDDEKSVPKDESIIVDYVLPDYSTRIHGYLRPYDPSIASKTRRLAGAAAGGGVKGGDGGLEKQEEFMTLGNERFTVPELLFNPMDIGMNQAGLPETVMQSLKALPGGVWSAMLANVVLIGGECEY